MFEASYLKEICNSFGMWAIVDLDWTKNLAEWIGEKPVLEVMAGAGWLAKALTAHGTDIQATDDFRWISTHRCLQELGIRSVHPVEEADAVKAAGESTAEVLIISWPPYEDDTATKVCDAWGSERPIIYIGESRGACNADGEFFDFFRSENIGIENPRFMGMHDRVSIGYWKR